MTGIYVHIPFCRSKCFYCDFPSYAGKENEYAAYRDALLREIQQSAELPETDGVDTIYMGGGSPTVFSSTDLADILEAIRDRTGRSDRVGRCAEITVEANPGTIQEETLQILKASGVNRLSMGLQAWQNHLLKTLGRIHSRALFLENYRKAMDAGFENISLDLMFALPGQTLADWTETLENAAALGPRHISAYSLIVEEKTPFHRWREEGRITQPDEETDRAMYAAASIILEKKGYCQYEISSFAKPGFACKHNCKYWRRENTLGFGLGAHSFWKETRWHNSYDLDGYTRDPCRREDVSRVMPDEAMEETMFLGLRMNEGVGLKEFERQFGATLPSIYGAALRKLTGQGLLQMDSERIRLTAKGRDVANRVFVEFIQ